MPTKVSTLCELCLQRTAELLRNTYWDAELPLSHNPFASLPPSVVDDLIVHVTRLSTRERPLLSSHLRLLLTSGRVRNFYFGRAHVSAENLQKIFLHLSTSCRNLIGVDIGMDDWMMPNSSIVAAALNSLLSQAQNVKRVKSRLEFDLRVLCNSVQLEKLNLDFSLTSPIYGFLEVNGQLRPHASLKHFEVFAWQGHKIPYSDTAVILKYCTELISINCDISKSLEHLHAEELREGNLTHNYKIQKCYLGRRYSLGDAIASRDAVLIVSLTCPHLRNVNMCINDVDAISALSNCQNLRALQVTWEMRPNETVDTWSPFEILGIGRNLKHLHLSCARDVDFPSVAECCPNLEGLRVEYVNICTRTEYSPTSFKKLQLLCLSKTSHEDIKGNILVGLLSNASNLKHLSIEPAEGFTDFVLKGVLKYSGLLKLEKLRISRCGLSLNGWRNLACSLTALETVYVGYGHCLGGIKRVFLECRPGVEVLSSEMSEHPLLAELGSLSFKKKKNGF